MGFAFIFSTELGLVLQWNVTYVTAPDFVFVASLSHLAHLYRSRMVPSSMLKACIDTVTFGTLVITETALGLCWDMASVSADFEEVGCSSMCHVRSLLLQLQSVKAVWFCKEMSHM